MMKRGAILFILLVFHSCSVQKQALKPVDTTPPQWVENRPISSAYYIGIGSAPISNTEDYQRLAKENALSDLASEIRVNVNTNSLLHTLETQNKFTQEYSETINLYSNLNLEDFERVDTWADDKTYSVYYRLNKAAYAENVLRKKKAAHHLALDFYTQGEEAKHNGDILAAVDYQLRGLQALENFWNEENRVEHEGQTLFLDNALYTALRNTLLLPQIKIEGPVILNVHNRYKTDSEILVTNSNDEAFVNLPLAFEYPGYYGVARGKVTTGAHGKAEITIANPDRERTDLEVWVYVNTDVLFESFMTDPFMHRLLENMKGSQIRKKINYNLPVVYIQSTEKNLGKKTQNAAIENTIAHIFTKNGITLSSYPKDADISITIQADTHQSTSSDGFFISTLEVYLQVEDILKSETKYKMSNNNIKGVDLSFEKAGLKAYQNFLKNMEFDILRPLLTDLL